MSCAHEPGSFRGMRRADESDDEVTFRCPSCGAEERVPKCRAATKVGTRCQLPQARRRAGLCRRHAQEHRAVLDWAGQGQG